MSVEDPACAGGCVYGTCRKTMADPYGCGGCCSCLGGCQAAHEREQAEQYQEKIEEQSR